MPHDMTTDDDFAAEEKPVPPPYSDSGPQMLEPASAWTLACVAGLIAAAWAAGAKFSAAEGFLASGWAALQGAAAFAVVAIAARWVLLAPRAVEVLACLLGGWAAFASFRGMEGAFGIGWRVAAPLLIWAAAFFGGSRALAAPTILLKNFATFVFVIWCIATITFFLAQAIPGGPFTQERSLPDHVKAVLEKRYNLDAPVSEQYWSYLKNLARFDLGPSYHQEGKTVNEIIGRGFPRSLRVGFWALLISLALGLPLGVCAALWQNRWQDYLALGIVVFGVSVPSFIFGAFEQYVLAFRLELLPPSGLDTWDGYLMPALALATLPGAFVIRLIRSEMIDVLGTQYIAAARARGLSAYSVVWKHALRNALLAVVTYMGPIAAALFTGSFVIEMIFDIPGLGREYVSAIGNRDYNLILGTTIFYAGLLVGLNMLIDSFYKVIDPRVGASEGGSA